MRTIVKIETTFGGPCVYRRAIFSDGSSSGRVQDVGQGTEKIKEQLLEYAENGKDDVDSFIDRVISRI